MAVSTGAALLGGAVIGGVSSLLGASKASSGAKSAAATTADATIAGTEMSVQAQREQLDYLKEVNKLPQQYREQALAKLSERTTDGSGIAPPKVDQQALIGQAQASPLYAALMGGRKAGEEGILRGAAATGGLRSGNVQETLYDYNVGLQNNALLEAYNRQYNQQQTGYGQEVSADDRRLRELQGLAGIDTGTSQISNVMGNIGTTAGQGVISAGQAMGQGQVAAGNAWQQGLQNVTNIGLGALGTGIREGLI